MTENRKLKYIKKKNKKTGFGYLLCLEFIKRQKCHQNGNCTQGKKSHHVFIQIGWKWCNKGTIIYVRKCVGNSFREWQMVNSSGKKKQRTSKKFDQLPTIINLFKTLLIQRCQKELVILFHPQSNTFLFKKLWASITLYFIWYTTKRMVTLRRFHS